MARGLVWVDGRKRKSGTTLGDFSKAEMWEFVDKLVVGGKENYARKDTGIAGLKA